MKDTYGKLDAVAQAELVRNGDVTALELVDAALARIERLNPRLNAVVTIDGEAARDRAKKVDVNALFAGVPTLLKDLMPYPNARTAFGSRFFAGQLTPSGSPYTEALDKSGLVVVGKSATSEFGLLGTTETILHGPTRNPWDVTLSTGGSSGGAVAAVASGMVPVAHASDGGGSVRGPAALCGLFGFKPSRGATVSNGIPDAMPTARMLSEHCVSRSVRDSAAWLEATALPGTFHYPPAAAPQQLRIGVYTTDSYGNPCDQEVANAISAVAALCEDLGHVVVECAAPQIDAEALAKAFFLAGGFGMASLLDQLRPLFGPAYDENNLEPYTKELVARARRAPENAIAEVAAVFAQAEKEADRSFAGDVDVVLSPTVPCTAFPLGTYSPEKDPHVLMDFTKRIAGFTVVASVAGWPAMSVPLKRATNGLPVGSHFTAMRGKDALLMSLAFQLEEAAPWARDWPAVNAWIS